ncbi:TPA: helix-turn-helix domain-containing protein [Pseudomonas aeruginosa]
MNDRHAAAKTIDLAELRDVFRLSQQDVGEILGVHRTTVIDWEKGKHPDWLPLVCLGLPTTLALRNSIPSISAGELTAARETLGMEQIDLANHLGVHVRTVRTWETKRPPAWLPVALIGLSLQLQAPFWHARRKAK